MLALIFVVDHWLAFLALMVLLLAAAVPLAIAWTRLVPEERPPFDLEPVHNVRPVASAMSRYVFNIALLTALSVGFVLQFPGIPRYLALQWIDHELPAIGPVWIFLGIQVLVATAGVAAASYSFAQPGPLRIPLGAASMTLVVLWIFAPFLRSLFLTGQ